MASYNKGIIHGWGINDADYEFYIRKDGGGIDYCPFYTKWKDMIKRVKCPLYHATHPTYIGSSIDEGWKKLMEFKYWMEGQLWEGLELDKDILVMGNKHYGPDTCAFVPKFLNYVLLTKLNGRGDNPLGVIRPLDKRYPGYVAKKPYVAQVNDEKRNYIKLGSFSEPLEAHRVWQLAKADVIEKQILRYMLEPSYRQDIANALYERAEMLRNHAEQGIETKSL